MTQRRSPWAVGGVVLALGLLTLTACGGSGASAATKPTPTPNAATILANASKVDYKDIEFKMTFTGGATATATSFSGSGVITKSPNRDDVKLSVTESGQSMNFEVLEDSDTKVSYVKISGMASLGIPEDKWIKSTGDSSTGGLGASFAALLNIFSPDQVTNFKDLQGVSLVGSETVDGVSVWHLKGSDTQSGSSGTADFYVRQSNGTPYKFVIHMTGDSAGDFTITFTGINTGATVTLPTPDQIFTMPGA